MSQNISNTLKKYLVSIQVNAAVVQWCTHSPDSRMVRDQSQTGATGLTKKNIFG